MTKRFDWLKEHPRYLLGSAIVLGLAVRLLGIEHSSIWHDEGYTLMLSPRDPGEIIEATSRDVHPPLYYLSLHYWMTLFGDSVSAVRGMSLFFGVLLIPLAYGIGRRLFGERVALTAALATALAPFLIRFSQEARMYTLVAFFTALATYALIRGLERSGWRWWSLYALSITAALYTQYYGGLILLPHAAYVIVRLFRGTPSQGFHNLGRFALASLGSLLLFLPWVPILLSQVSRVGSGFWIRPEWITVQTVPNTLHQFLVYDHLNFLRGFLHWVPLAVFVGLTAWALYRFRERRREIFFVITLFLVPLLVMWGYSELRTPVYQDRYFPFAALGFYLMMAIWVWTPRSPWGRSLLAILLATVLVGGIVGVYVSGRHQMREAAEEVNAGFRPGDEVVSLELYTYFDFSYYNETPREALLYYRGPFQYGEPGLLLGREDLRVADLEEIDPASGRIWTVGKSGEKDYYRDIPPNWELIRREARESTEIRLYQVVE